MSGWHLWPRRSTLEAQRQAQWKSGLRLGDYSQARWLDVWQVLLFWLVFAVLFLSEVRQVGKATLRSDTYAKEGVRGQGRRARIQRVHFALR